MKHYLILKFHDRASASEVAERARAILGRLPEELAGARSVQVVLNGLNRAENHDLMIEMNFDDEGVVEKYLGHKRHAEFVAFAGPLVASKVTFDRR